MNENENENKNENENENKDENEKEKDKGKESGLIEGIQAAKADSAVGLTCSVLSSLCLRIRVQNTKYD